MKGLITAYFDNLLPTQIEKFHKLKDIYEDWNSKINVISRKDIENFDLHHLLHSLAIAKIINFEDATRIVDIGTGGGFPGIPLSIMFPDCKFTLVDSIKKKTLVVKSVAETLELDNIEVICERAENINQKFDFIVSRAVTSFPKFVSWTKNMLSSTNNNSLKNGILYLKGGDLSEELGIYQKKVSIYNLSNYFTESFFEEKKIVYMPL